ncbi:MULTISPECIES: phosphoethanolamine transferase [unclassified Pseudomonas]|uniref:phosphoethanolamine transferase n=1 Tax=unclassified Pseudomonas TaxID=196821 RepID=UPI0024479F62|nr:MULTISPECIES: phosphoethanolamine transferase [unclassified Pseudomonas]MDH0304746.1 phosphoethanolamine transferase [Pseudomonas sp. GD04091]MDH1988170.1 phosphoethanolamine transferase [Pseudomonas sp. GD03689]
MLMSLTLRGQPERGAAWLRLCALASLSCVLLLADDFIQQLFTGNNRAELEAGWVAGLWAFCVALWLCNLRVVVVAILLLFAGMQLLQLANISFFGEPLSAVDIRSLVREPGEVGLTAWHSLGAHWPAALSVALPYVLLVTLHWRLPGRVALPASRWALLLIAVVLLAKPYRATYRNLDSFTPGPTRSGLHNSLNAFSAWAVRLAFAPEVRLPSAPFTPYRLEPIPSSARHVWLVVADSLRSERMGVYGYARQTTPRLQRYLASHPSALVRPGVSAGVATDVSLPYLLNPIREPGQDHLLRAGEVNLFRFAREAGMRTHWISSQESRLLAHLGSRHLDVAITREDHPLRFLKRQDHALLEILDQQRFGPRNFVVLNLRTAHLPYARNYTHQQAERPWPDQGAQGQANAYDNSIHYLDGLLEEVIARFDRLEGERYLVITGDHGQRLGEDGKWGHNDLVPQVSDVPVIVLSREAPRQALEGLAPERWISHYEIGKWLAARLGMRIDNPNLRKDEHFVHGKLLFSDNYIQPVCETAQGLVHLVPVQLSEWLARGSQGACGS